MCEAERAKHHTLQKGHSLICITYIALSVPYSLFANVCQCVCMRACVRVCACVRACVCVCVRVCVRAYVRQFMRVYACMFVCVAARVWNSVCVFKYDYSRSES